MPWTKSPRRGLALEWLFKGLLKLIVLLFLTLPCCSQSQCKKHTKMWWVVYSAPISSVHCFPYPIWQHSPTSSGGSCASLAIHTEKRQGFPNIRLQDTDSGNAPHLLTHMYKQYSKGFCKKKHKQNMSHTYQPWADTHHATYNINKRWTPKLLIFLLILKETILHSALCKTPWAQNKWPRFTLCKKCEHAANPLLLFICWVSWKASQGEERVNGIPCSLSAN